MPEKAPLFRASENASPTVRCCLKEHATIIFSLHRNFSHQKRKKLSNNIGVQDSAGERRYFHMLECIRFGECKISFELDGHGIRKVESVRRTGRT